MKQLTLMTDGSGWGGEVREIECACGCGEVFQQPKVGRKRMYVNDTHKSRAYRQRARVAALKGDELMAFAEWIGGVSDALAQGAKWESVTPEAMAFFAVFNERKGSLMFNGFYDAIALFRSM